MKARNDSIEPRPELLLPLRGRTKFEVPERGSSNLVRDEVGRGWTRLDEVAVFGPIEGSPVTPSSARSVSRAGARSPERLTVAEAVHIARHRPYRGMESVRQSVSERRIARCEAEDGDQLSTAEAGWLLCRPRQYVVDLIRSRKLKATKAPFRDSWRWLVRFGDVKRIA